MAPLTVLLVLGLSACGSMRNYKAETDSLAHSASSNNLDAAIATLEANNKGDDKDLLYFFEKGALLHAKNDIPASTQAWLSADEKIKLWEEAVKTDPAKVIGQVGSFLVNDKIRRYDGYDYEKVMLSTFLAVNHTLAGNWDDARTEIKKTHEREALIAEFRAKEYEAQEAEAKNNNIRTTYKDLRGYPVETLDDPNVTALRNGYQSAFSHYLAGFVYEALGEPSLAAPGYRKAIELRPNVNILEEGLSGVDGRLRKHKTGETDVLFIVEAGTAPARQSMAIPLPYFWRGNLYYTQISFPVIRSDRRVFVPQELRVDNSRVAVSEITSIDAMSRRALRDELPGIIVRSTIRAIAKGATQKELSRMGGWAGLAGGLLGAVTTAVTEQADERVWRTLPAHIAIGRAVLPAGKHTLTFSSPGGPQRIDINVAGKYAIVPIRLMGSTTYALQPDLTKVARLSSTPQPEPEVTNNVSVEQKETKLAGSKSKKKPNLTKLASLSNEQPSDSGAASRAPVEQKETKSSRNESKKKSGETKTADSSSAVLPAPGAAGSAPAGQKETKSSGNELKKKSGVAKAAEQSSSPPPAPASSAPAGQKETKPSGSELKKPHIVAKTANQSGAPSPAPAGSAPVAQKETTSLIKKPKKESN